MTMMNITSHRCHLWFNDLCLANNVLVVNIEIMVLATCYYFPMNNNFQMNALRELLKSLKP